MMTREVVRAGHTASTGERRYEVRRGHVPARFGWAGHGRAWQGAVWPNGVGFDFFDGARQARGWVG